MLCWSDIDDGLVIAVAGYLFVLLRSKIRSFRTCLSLALSRGLWRLILSILVIILRRVINIHHFRPFLQLPRIFFRSLFVLVPSKTNRLQIRNHPCLQTYPSQKCSEQLCAYVSTSFYSSGTFLEFLNISDLFAMQFGIVLVSIETLRFCIQSLQRHVS